MEILPLKPNPWMAVLPVNLGWLPNKPVLGWGWGCSTALSCLVLAQAPGRVLVGSLDLPQVSRMRFGLLSFFLKSELEFMDMACHAPRALQIVTL